MKFSSRLYAAFAVCIVFTVALGLFSLWQIGSLSGHLREISQMWMPSVQSLLTLKSEAREFRTQELQLLLSVNAAERSQWESRLDDTRALIERQLDAYVKLISSKEERAAFESLREKQQHRFEAHGRVRALLKEERHDEALALARGEVSRLRAETAAVIEQMVSLNVAGSDREAADAASAVQGTRVLIPAGIALATVLSAVLAVLIVRSTMRQLGGEPSLAREVLERIADGDLATAVPAARGDADSLMATLARMRENLAGIVMAIAGGSEAIRVASEEVARGNLDLSSRTEQQSSNLEETASALEQLSSTVKQTATNAKSADAMARAASEVAVQGGETVSQVVQTMAGISESSLKMRDIISVIDGIAFQTNILALNAAVEAARAGEQGRGFAVVASEVRTLAQRSANAAHEIKRLIEDSVSRVQDGGRLAGQAGAAMGEMVASVKQVTEVVADIALAADQQSVGIGQINEAVNQLDGVTQQNAALVEQASAATQSMTEQADRLATTVRRFRVPA